MKKPYIVLALSLFLVGCDVIQPSQAIQYVPVEEEPTPNAPNPYDKMSAKQIFNLSDNAICENISEAIQQNFRINKLVKREYNKRRLSDCSPAEIFCHGDAGLKVGTEKFAYCKLKFMEQQNQVEYKEQEIALHQQAEIQQQERESRSKSRATLRAVGEALSHSHDNIGPPSFSTNRSMSCNSYTYGNSTQTNCY